MPKLGQLSLDSARKPTGRGGWRPGAGRPRKPGAVSHAQRPSFPARFPQHVTLRLGPASPSIARAWLMAKVLRPAIGASHKEGFRVVEFNVLSNHVHLIVEADGEVALARGVQGLAIRIARRTNSALKRRGKLFGQRYHARQLRTAAQVRFALRYVLLNRKHHASGHGALRRFFRGWIDPFSSGVWFRGWAEPLPTNTTTRGLLHVPAPTAKPHTWLLRTGWRRAGPLSYDDQPA